LAVLSRRNYLSRLSVTDNLCDFLDRVPIARGSLPST
jgi:hypothetical protein